MHARMRTGQLFFLLPSIVISLNVYPEPLKSPSCEALGAWVSTIDANDRWTPFQENTRLWLPNAMASPTFDTLFGKAALDMSQADVQAARRVWNGCIQVAKRARDREQQSALSTSRKYLTSNLRNAVRYAERRPENAGEPTRRDAQAEQHTRERQREPASARARRQEQQQAATPLSRSVDTLTAQAASLESLTALALLNQLDATDADAVMALERKFGSMRGTPATSSAYTILRELRIRGASEFETFARPRISERLSEVKPSVLQALKEDFSQNPADLHERRLLAQRYEMVMAELKPFLNDGEWRALADEARAARRAIVDSALTEAKSAIDMAPTGERGISIIDEIVAQFSERGPDARQRRELTSHAQARQRILADELLKTAIETELPAIPETWAGIAALDELNGRLAKAVSRRASSSAAARFNAALSSRLAQIGRKALPEFEDQLATLPETEEGLTKADEWLVHTKAWHVMDEAVRRDYQAAAERRRDRIAVVVEQARAEQRASNERARQRAVAAGADPRIVGHRWIDANNTMMLDFRDERLVVVNALGFEFAGTYEVSRDDVIVKGPHGQLLYTIKDDTLSGNGTVLRIRND